MFDPFLLTRFLVVAHAVACTGLAAWFFGVIPRSSSERRFLPLGCYMLVATLAELATWAGFYNPAIAGLSIWSRLIVVTLATLLLGYAFYIHRRYRPSLETWPLRARLSLCAHFIFAFIPPLLISGAENSPDRIVPLIVSLFTLAWLVFGNLPSLRHQGHLLHWSMVASVLGALLLGWVAMARVQTTAMRNIDEDLLARIVSFAELVDVHLLDADGDTLDRMERLEGALETMSSTAGPISGAFLLSPQSEARGFIARVAATNKQPVPTFDSPARLASFASESRASVHRFRDLDDGRRWHVALAPVRPYGDDRVVAIAGLLAPNALVEKSMADSMLVTDSIVFLFALIVYGCIAGYLQGLVRVWQRDTLLEINAEHAQQLLETTAPQEIAIWLVKQLQQRLNLVHAAFWIHSDQGGEAGFKPIVRAPVHRTQKASQWHALSELPSAWREALARGQSIEGDLRELGVPLPGMIPDVVSSPWGFVENIQFNAQLYASLVVVFPDRNFVARGEIRSALRSLTAAFASCLVREQRSDHLAAAEERLRTIIETSPDGFWDADYTRDQCYRSDRWWQMLGHDAPTGEVDPHAFEDLIEAEDLEQLQADAIEPLPPGRKFRRREYRARHRDGSWRWIESNTVEIRPVTGAAQRALGFDRDVTHRHDYEQRLRESAESAARANRAKSEFLATMNHELRTPLNSVIGFATILDRSPLNPSQRDWVSSMRGSAEQLLGLISDVLDFSRIEAGRLELEVAPFELRRATEQALEHFTRMATEKEIALHHEFHTNKQPSWVVGDALRLRQILTNLVGNAVKFTKTGFVRLSTRPLEDDKWRFEIEDTGPGIPADQLGSLFNRFSQIDASSTRAHGGTGLGLAISRELARAMQGDIEVLSNDGVGSIFSVVVHLPQAQGEKRRYTDHSVSLGLTVPVFMADEHDLSALENALTDTNTRLKPCASPSALIDFIEECAGATTVIFPRAFRPESKEGARKLRRALKPHHPPVMLLGLQAQADLHPPSPFDTELAAPLRRRDLINALDFSARRESTPPFPMAKEPSRSPFAANQVLRVLVAEDHPVNREVVRTMLEQLGIQADFAENGQIAIERMTDAPYDLALIDIQMPVLDGFEVAEWVRSRWSPSWPPPRLVAVTANATHGDRDRCIQAGMDEYIAKPVTFATLTDLIENSSSSNGDSQTSSQAARPAQSVPTPAATTTAGDHLVDWESFDSILNFTSAAENPEVLQRIIGTYRTDLDAVLTAVSARSIEDHAETRKLLHKLKGSSGSLALMGVVSTIKRLHDPEVSPPAAEKTEIVARIREESELAIAAVFVRYPWLKE